METIIENEKAILWKVDMKDYHFFEVWIKIVQNRGKFAGQILNPKDEDFGVWAWCFYTEDRARKCFDEITDGTRQIRPMLEIV